MNRIYSIKMCKEALITDITNSLLDKLKQLLVILEGIRKNLNQFLETKRMDFPRFFFISNEDLLEIIGQSKEPGPINRHINKFFEGIKELVSLPPTGSKQSKIY